MNFKKSIAVTMIATSTLIASTFYVQADQGEQAAKSKNEIEVIAAKVTLEQAVDIAKLTIPGMATKIDFSNDEGVGIWEVEIIDANKVTYDVEIDATSGKVVKQKVDKPDKEKHNENDDDENENEDEND